MASNRFRQLVADAVESDTPVDETLFAIVRLITHDPDYHFRQSFLFEGLNSTKIVKLLSFFENESVRIRKLALLFFALVVANPKSKVYFLEKCGFGLSFGKILFTRMKYLQTAMPRGLDPVMVVRSFIQTVNAAKRPTRQALFWFVPISSFDEPSLRVINFYESVLENRLTAEYLMEILPDPLDNMCGFEFTEFDLPDPHPNPQLLMSEPPRPVQSTSVENLDYRTKIKSGKQRLAIEKSEEFNSNMGRSTDGMSPANKSANKRGKNTPLEVFQKYRSSIKDRTPSLNVKKEPKSSSIVVPKRADPSPVRTPKAPATDPKTENKNTKSQKINDILQKAKVSKSPAATENRANVSERLSKILGPRTKA